MENKKGRTWVEINLDHMTDNLNIAKRNAGKREIMCVVKADAYGHGAVPVATTFMKEGVRHFAVATPEEALQLRRHGIQGEILILGTVDPSVLEELNLADIALTVSSEEIAAMYAGILMAKGMKQKIHIKINSGMNRQGITADDADAVERICKIAAYPCFEIKGLYTHFAVADTPEEDAFTEEQYKKTSQIVKKLMESGIAIPLVHVANSAGILTHSSMEADMMRPGIMLYGSNPCLDFDAGLEPTMKLCTRISGIREVKKGETVSYGRTWKAERDSMIAVLNIGYADGLMRCLSGVLPVLVGGKRVKQVGRICMDMCMVDVTDVPGVKIGDVAVIFGRQGEEEITVDEIADLARTISYEIFCAVGKRVSRVYIRDGREVDEVCYIDAL